MNTTLETWSKAGWIRHHQTSPEEVRDLWLIVQRDLRNAADGTISQDWQFGIAYNAALKLRTILLHVAGYRPGKGQSGQNYALRALPYILGPDRQKHADYLNSCREKRNTAEYDHVGRVSKREVSDLIEFTRTFSDEVLRWLAATRPGIARQLAE